MEDIAGILFIGFVALSVILFRSSKFHRRQAEALERIAEHVERPDRSG
ncbi:hypothetical protein FIU90_13505 [Erythrobacter sp. THAF29]|nr:hypothetical protein FIU90_13505 [Erythrobacter sp. THAF29]